MADPVMFDRNKRCHDCSRLAVMGTSRCVIHGKRHPKPKGLPWWVAESRVCVRESCRQIYIPSVYSQITCSKECGKVWRGRRLYHRAKQYRTDRPEWFAAQKKLDAKNQTAKRRGMTEAEFESRVAAQNNLCPIGNHPFVGRGQDRFAPVRDHCHMTGMDRAILCSEHNRALGGFHDSPIELQDAIGYVQKWSADHSLKIVTENS